MRVSLKTGSKTVSLPDELLRNSDVLLPRIPEDDFSDEEIVNMLGLSMAKPAGDKAFSDCIRPGGRTCIVVSDKTRSYGLDIWLQALVDKCNECGVPDEKITILFGGGAHGPQTKSEKIKIVGDTVAAKVCLVDHDCDDAASLAHVGVTAAGTPVKVNRLAVESDNLVLTGIVMPHYYAGFTGGRKSVLPGISARESIFANHGLNLAAGGGTHPGARTMLLEGNPIHEDMLDALRFVNVNYSVNVIVGGNGRPAAFFSGDIRDAHRQACVAAKEWMGTKIDAKRDWVIASAGGYPKDISFYQSHKALDNASRAVKPGGVIVLLAECSEGLGPAGFDEWFRMNDRTIIESRLRGKYSVMGHTALRTLEKTSAAKVVLVSAMAARDAQITGAQQAATLEDAIKYIDLEKRGYVIPNAAMTVPVLAGGDE